MLNNPQEYMQDNIRSLLDKAQAKYSANTFTPTDAHKRAKSAFWSHFFQTGEIAPATIEIATASRYSGYDVTEWWSVLGFKEWFSNGEEFRQKVEFLSSLALEYLQTVLTDQSARTGDKLAAAKMSLEIAAKFPKSQPKEQFTDEAIASMDKDQLESFIKAKVKSMNVSDKSVDIASQSSDTIEVNE